MRRAPLTTLFATIASVNGFALPEPPKSPLPSPSPSPPPPPAYQTPNERQMAMMKSMGYVWDGTKWGRGNPTSYQNSRSSARSGNRFIRFVDPKRLSEGATSPAAVAAAERFGDVLQTARDGVLSRAEKERARDRDWKNLIAARAAPFVWVAVQVLVFVLLSSSSSSLVEGGAGEGGLLNFWSNEINRCSPSSISIGTIAGLILAESRSQSRRLRPGVEESDGALERILADSIDGNYALPAPSHVRASSGVTWTTLALVGEVIASLNVALALHAVLQSTLIRVVAADNGMWFDTVDDGSYGFATITAYGVLPCVAAAVTVALPSVLRAVRHSSMPLDGVLAECEAAARAKRNAMAYFNMNPPRNADAVEASNALCVLADGWTDKFGFEKVMVMEEGDDGTPSATTIAAAVRWKETVCAFVGSFACAIAWQVSGCALVAPFLARVVGSVDTYVVRHDGEAGRASVVLPDVSRSLGYEDLDELEKTGL